MAKRMTDTDKWKKPFIRSLPAPYKLLWLYILDDCDHAGIWQVDIEVAEIRIGEKLSKEEAIKHFKEKIEIINDEEKWLIKDFTFFQYGNLNPLNRMHLSVIQILEKNGITPNKPLISPLKGVKDKDKVKEQVKDKDNRTKPTISEVQEYCVERKNSVNVNTWYDHYESNGWKVGRNPMKDWKACVRKWEGSNSYSQQKNNKQHTLSTDFTEKP